MNKLLLPKERKNMSVIGYIRVSSSKQTVAHQHFEIQKFATLNQLNVDQWIEETISSRKALNTRKLGHLLKNLHSGDILITTEISRLGRSLLEVMHILETCLNKSCQVWTIKENYRLGNDIQSKVMAFAFGISAEIERQLISERTKAALESVKNSGKKLGRPFSAQSKKLKLTKNTRKIQKLLNAGVSQNKISQIMGVQNATLRRFLKRTQLITKESRR